jgi:hypothetical protein
MLGERIFAITVWRRRSAIVVSLPFFPDRRSLGVRFSRSRNDVVSLKTNLNLSRGNPTSALVLDRLQQYAHQDGTRKVSTAQNRLRGSSWCLAGLVNLCGPARGSPGRCPALHHRRLWRRCATAHNRPSLVADYSLQLLGTGALPRPRHRVPNLGVLAHLCHPQLDIHRDPHSHHQTARATTTGQGTTQWGRSTHFKIGPTVLRTTNLFRGCVHRLWDPARSPCPAL